MARAPRDSTLVSRFEFHRWGIALIPSPSRTQRTLVGATLSKTGDGSERFCTCKVSRQRECRHLRQANAELGGLVAQFGGGRLDAEFRAGVWFKLLGPLADASQVDASSVRLETSGEGEQRTTRVFDPQGRELAAYYATGDQADRFVERFRPGNGSGAPTRADALALLIQRTRTPTEQQLLAYGARSRGQAAEESFWFRLAYHGFREFGHLTVEFRTAVDLESGIFTVCARLANSDRDLLRFTVPGPRVKSLVGAFSTALPGQESSLTPLVPAEACLRIHRRPESDLVEVEPVVRLCPGDGPEHLCSLQELERFRYGELVYIPELDVLAEFESLSTLPRRWQTPGRVTLKVSEIPALLGELSSARRHDETGRTPRVVGLTTIDRFERVEMTAQALDRDWWWLSVEYDLGNTRLSLGDLLGARRTGERFVATRAGWVDWEAVGLEPLAELVERHTSEEARDPAQGIKLSRLEVLRLSTTAPAAVALNCRDGAGEALARLIELRPSRELGALSGLTSTLRDYQRRGTEWLLFLYDHGLGGLLCDEMGLGKTHQTLGLVVALREERDQRAPCLVVCPATVLPHWERLAGLHASGLRIRLFYGGERDLEGAMAESDIVLTSYGVLRNDIEALSRVEFAVAVFDEIQTLKNHETQVHRAARQIVATMRVGLTGTPIENRPSELWALFEVVLPGYLGTFGEFERRYGVPIEGSADSGARHQLGRLIFPFTLRRRKSAVLTELPPKIEDLRLCRLSADQVKLYRDAVSSRGASLLPLLSDASHPIPYVHVFTLLDLLKRICAHPALVAASPEESLHLTSGKWELFRELLGEALESQQKVVVYSQFLGMIRLMSRYLEREGIGHVTLTGASRQRGEIVRRFNQDAGCRVFVGSLKAGGVGIDLVSASVVIHYDRWWNAAKEDQATDRVHRFGQQRGVQVFKLVTEGTLEEKIAALIERKRMLTDELVSEDAPEVLKTLSREELIELLKLDEGEVRMFAPEPGGGAVRRGGR